MYLLLVQSSGCSYPVNDVSHKALQKSFCGMPMLLCVVVLHSANMEDSRITTFFLTPLSIQPVACHTPPLPIGHDAFDVWWDEQPVTDSIFKTVVLATWMHACLCELVYDVLVLLTGNKMWLDLPGLKEPAQKGCAGCQPTHAQQTARLHVHLARQTDASATLRKVQCANLQRKCPAAFID